jgi:hypothetical protein
MLNQAMLKKTRHRDRPRIFRGALTLALIATLTLVPTLAPGQTVRCGSQLITHGTSQAKVAALCGQPAQVVRPPLAEGVAPGVSDVEEETWVYNFGPNRFMQRIRFHDGVVASISSVGYGY